MSSRDIRWCHAEHRPHVYFSKIGLATIQRLEKSHVDERADRNFVVGRPRWLIGKDSLRYDRPCHPGYHREAEIGARAHGMGPYGALAALAHELGIVVLLELTEFVPM